MSKKFVWFLGICRLVCAGLWGANTSLFVTELDQHSTRLIAHLGVHHIYAGSDRSADSCHASPAETFEHHFIENTLPSMQEAFGLGADVVEIDVHLTPEHVFAVFHDWTLDCRTDGIGVTHKHSFDALRALDVGYWIDDGSGTYPLRGRARGLMPSLTGVFDAGIERRQWRIRRCASKAASIQPRRCGRRHVRDGSGFRHSGQEYTKRRKQSPMVDVKNLRFWRECLRSCFPTDLQSARQRLAYLALDRHRSLTQFRVCEPMNVSMLNVI